MSSPAFYRQVGEACDLVFYIALIPNHDTSTAPHHFAKDNFIPLHNLQVYRFSSSFEAFNNIITRIDKAIVVQRIEVWSEYRSSLRVWPENNEF